MAISYVSQVREDTPYILPVDLNLLGRVNQYKQTMFYKNASVLKQQMAQLKNTDILNEEQSNLLKEGYNQVVNHIKNAGPLDYSDLNIVNQIEGLGAQVYENPYILNGIVSTKQVRKLHSIYEKMKTDPKYAKQYSAANEAWDNEYVRDYINGGIDASYKGTGTPTLYLGNTFDILTKKIKELKPDIDVKFDPVTENPYYIDKSENTVLTENRINALLEAVVTPELKNQMNIEGWYKNRNATDDDIINEYTRRYDSDTKVATANVARLQELKDVATKDEEKQFYQTQIDNQNNYLSRLSENHQERLKSFPTILSTREGRASALGNIYSRDIFDNIIKAYSYDQTKRQMILDASKIHEDKIKLGYYQAAIRAASKKGDDPEGATPGVVDPENPLFESVPTNAQGSEILYTADNIDEKIATEAVAMLTDTRQFFLNNGGAGLAGYISDNVPGLDGKKGLSVEDLKLLKPILQNVQGVDRKAIQYLDNVILAYDKAARGDFSALEGVNFSMSSFQELYRKNNLRNLEIEHMTALKNNAYKEALENKVKSSKLSDNEKALISRISSDLFLHFDEDGKPTTREGQLALPALRKANLLDEQTTLEKVEAFLISPFSNNTINHKGNNIRLNINKLKPDVEKFFKNPEKNTVVNIGNKIYLNSKEIEKKRSDIINFVISSASGLNNVDKEYLLGEKPFVKSSVGSKYAEIPLSEDLHPEKSKVSVTAVSILNNQADRKNKYVAEIEFKYIDKNGVSKTAFKKLNASQAQSLGLPVINDLDIKENNLLQMNKSLPTNYKWIDNWQNNNVIGYKIEKAPGGNVQIRILGNNGGNDILIQKMRTPTGLSTFQSSYEAKYYIENVLNNLGKTVDRESAFKALIKEQSI